MLILGGVIGILVIVVIGKLKTVFFFLFRGLTVWLIILMWMIESH